MVLKDILSKEKRNVFMLSNEAMVRGALEADVKVVAFYPGSPSSEILDTFSEFADSFDYKVEIATNEKVALEICAGAAFAGFRTLTAMKSVGTNVASDALFVLGYTGVRGGMVLIMADDPHAHSSQSEEDGRFFAPNTYIPMLEPSTPAEAKAMVKKAFELSEKYRTIVLIRTVTRVNHQSGIVPLEEMSRKEFKKVKWRELNEEFITLGETARKKKLGMLERTKKIQEEFEKSEFNFTIDRKSDVGIITSSVSYNYVLESLDILNLKANVLKLGTTYPLPKKLIGSFIKNLKNVIVVEELSPYLEKEITAIAKDANPSVKIFGKYSGHFSEAWEYNIPVVVTGIGKALNLKYPDYNAFVEKADKLKSIIPDRHPTFCAGCPHRGTFSALYHVIKARPHFFSNDIGCYSMWSFPPIKHTDSSLCMGASIGVANGLQHVIEERVIAVVGDSTFFHAALPALVNAVHNKNKLMLIILDNSVTAMTGQQSNPSTENIAGGKQGKKIQIENIIRALGIDFVEIVDSYEAKANVEVFRRAFEYDGISVIISRRECALYGDRIKRKKGVELTPYEINKEKCKKLYMCMKNFYCPAYEVDSDGLANIRKEMCDGCGVCSKLCPVVAVQKTGAKQ
ncbi:MAG: indolepyruvate ferredoxin oxidoreductase subunit alpha [Thermoplasmata archaeon]